jgi:hypothetical protein
MWRQRINPRLVMWAIVLALAVYLIVVALRRDT